MLRNSAELRRFSSPHPSIFSEFLGSNEKGMEARAYIGWETPVARGGGRQAPVAHWRGDMPPPPARDLFANSKKKYIMVLSPVAWAATGKYFRNLSKWTYIFEIFIF